ncbi:MAG: AIR synthase related protein, partial [Acidobacteriota bacterium]|nr:AIR synthase related protein [Acidobacteriota bacterium]
MRSEFGFLKHLKNHFNLSKIGDDCAVIPKDARSDYLITTDTLVEDIDFRLEWTTAKLLGCKALSVSISDVAAMGGIPRYSMISVSIPESLWATDFLDRFYEGYIERANNFDRFHLPGPPRVVELIGGDISNSDCKMTVDSTVIGEVPRGKAILRSGAKPGDRI